MIMELVTIIFAIIMLAFTSFGGKGFVNALLMCIDLTTLICILILSLPVLARGGLWKDFIRAFKLMSKKFTCRIGDLKRTKDAIEFMQKQILYSGVIVTTFSFISILWSLDNLSALGPNLSVSLITVLYTAILELLLLPLQVEAKKRIIEYMEEE